MGEEDAKNKTDYGTMLVRAVGRVHAEVAAMNAAECCRTNGIYGEHTDKAYVEYSAEQARRGIVAVVNDMAALCGLILKEHRHGK